METVSGIIISLAQYKDNQFIASILSKESLYSASLTLNKRKENNSIQKFSFGEFELYKGPTKYFKVKSFSPKFMMLNVFGDFDRLLSLDFISELLMKIEYETLEVEKIFELTLETIKNIDDLSNDSKFLTLYFYYNILKLLGLDPTYTKFYEKEKLDLDDKNFKKNIDKTTFLTLFKYFSEIISNYHGIYLNSFVNFR